MLSCLYRVYSIASRRPGKMKQPGGAIPGGLGHRSPPVGSRGEAPVGGLGDEVPQKLKPFCKLLHKF